MSENETRKCENCGGPLPAGSRRDRKTCSGACREALSKKTKRGGTTRKPTCAGGVTRVLADFADALDALDEWLPKVAVIDARLYMLELSSDLWELERLAPDDTAAQERVVDAFIDRLPQINTETLLHLRDLLNATDRVDERPQNIYVMSSEDRFLAQRIHLKTDVLEGSRTVAEEVEFIVTDDDDVREIAHEFGLDGWAATLVVRDEIDPWWTWHREKNVTPVAA